MSAADSSTRSRKITVTVNGVERSATVDVRRTLADFLRHDLNLTGTHLGCEHGVCGACTVIFDGRAIRGCLTLAVQADGACVSTVEGLSEGERLHPLQEAFHSHHGLQCGYCTPGILMTLVDFLSSNPEPDEYELRLALSGNLCRCTGYQNIVDAALDAAARLRTEQT